MRDTTNTAHCATSSCAIPMIVGQRSRKVCVMAAATNSQQSSTALPSGTWNVDPVHSTVEFQVLNMGIVWVKGLFTDFKGTLESTGEPAGVRASGTIEVASLDTRSEQRDQHLQWCAGCPSLRRSGCASRPGPLRRR